MSGIFAAPPGRGAPRLDAAGKSVLRPAQAQRAPPRRLDLSKSDIRFASYIKVTLTNLLLEMLIVWVHSQGLDFKEIAGLDPHSSGK